MMRLNCRGLRIAFVSFWIGGCWLLKSNLVHATPSVSAHHASEHRQSGITIRSDFPGGRMNACEQVDEGRFVVTIAPEHQPINDSAWYAFQVSSEVPQTIQIELRYLSGSHRYDPKISHDGKSWRSGDHLIQSWDRSGRSIVLQVSVDKRPLWIAGQELLTRDDVARWSSDLANLPYVDTETIGHSVEGRPLKKLTIHQCDQPDYVVVLARQHPPEVSGAIGMMHFVDAIASDSPIAQQFRQRYATLVIPTVNPDGVHHGHWRCNANGVDLNRDWYHFTQPETRAVRQQVLDCQQDPVGKLCLFVDFHSTFEDVFYTPPLKDDCYPKNFNRSWLAAIAKRFPSYQVNVDDGHNAHRSTSKAWVHRNLGVSAVTYEFGDDTDRDIIKRIAGGAAEEMMRLLLALPEDQASPELRVAQRSSVTATDDDDRR